MALGLQLFLNMCVCVCVYLCTLTDLPHSNNSIRDEDEEDDKGLDKSSHSFFSFLKPSQHLRQSHTEYKVEGAVV